MTSHSLDIFFSCPPVYTLRTVYTSQACALALQRYLGKVAHK